MSTVKPLMVFQICLLPLDSLGTTQVVGATADMCHMVDRGCPVSCDDIKAFIYRRDKAPTHEIKTKSDVKVKKVSRFPIKAVQSIQSSTSDLKCCRARCMSVHRHVSNEIASSESWLQGPGTNLSDQCCKAYGTSVAILSYEIGLGCVVIDIVSNICVKNDPSAHVSV